MTENRLYATVCSILVYCLLKIRFKKPSDVVKTIIVNSLNISVSPWYK